MDRDSDSLSSSSGSSTDMAYGGSNSLSDNEEMGDAEEDQDSDWYYAVVIGRCRGIFTSLSDALRSTKGYSYAKFKKFPMLEDAHEFLKDYGLQVDNPFQVSDGSRLWFAYAMNSGRGDFPDAVHPSSISAFCGGSAFTNGDPECDAAYSCIFPHNRAWDIVRTLDGQDRPWPTSNRAEYMGALAALERANIEDPDQKKVLFIYSASRLLLESMSKWIYRWRNNGWRTVIGTDIQNRDILEKLMAAQGNRRVQWRRVKAHSGRRTWEAFWNEIAHYTAREAAQNMSNL